MKNVSNEELVSVCRRFGIEGELTKSKPVVEGHINSAYLAVFDEDGETKKYLVQNVNIHVFRNHEVLMHNIISVTSYLKNVIAETGGDPSRGTLNFLQCDDGKYTWLDGENCWRIYDYIDKVHTYSMIDNPATFEKAAKGFGKFQMQLNGFDGSILGETIPDFHNTPARVRNLKSAIEKDVVGRKAEVEKEIAFALEREEECGLALKLLEEGKIPLRVTHNDTKINNLLFDDITDEGICVIDLDTIMPGLSLYDFGDAIRSGAAMSAEDDPDPIKAGTNLELFESYVKGYMETCGSVLTPAEIESLAFGAKLMTYECGVRFLTDYLEGDTYFRIDRPKQNLDRTRNQFAMVADMEKKYDEMCSIVEKYAAKIK